MIEIDQYAFSNCRSLKSIVLPDSLTSIRNSTFSYCRSLRTAKLGNAVSYIGELAFCDCISLEHINIPNSVVLLNSGAIYRWEAITYNEHDNAYYLGDDENPYLVLIRAKDTSITSCEINEKCRFIYSSAFFDCASLTSITIPNSVTTIGSSAFYRCSSLKSISLPNSVTTIEGYAFAFSGIESITLPDSVTTIGQEAFTFCSYLKTISLPSSLTYIDKNVFDESSSLQYNEYDNAYYLGNDENPYLVLVKAKDTSITSCNINERCRYILNNAFLDCASIKSIVVPDSVINIGYAAFENCDSLESMTLPFIGMFKDQIPNSVYYNTLGGIFRLSGSGIPHEIDYPPSLRTITLTKECKTVNAVSFRSCSSLVSITLPKSVDVIYTSIFLRCVSFSDIYYEGSISDWNKIGKANTWMTYPSSIIVHCSDGDITVER